MTNTIKQNLAAIMEDLELIKAAGQTATEAIAERALSVFINLLNIEAEISNTTTPTDDELREMANKTVLEAVPYLHDHLTAMAIKQLELIILFALRKAAGRG